MGPVSLAGDCGPGICTVVDVAVKIKESLDPFDSFLAGTAVASTRVVVDVRQ
jgi:hypothetical protein